MTDKEIYIQFCEDEKNLPIYFKPWFIEGVSTEGEWDVVIAEKGGEVAAAMPYFIKEKGIYKYITMPHLGKIMGPYIANNFKKSSIYRKLLKELIAGLPSNDFYFQNFHYDIVDWLPFYWQKYGQKTLYSYILQDLDKLDEIYSGFSRFYRNKAIPEAQTIVEIKEDMDPKLFYEINKEAYTKQNKKIPHSYKDFEAHHNSLQENNSGKIFYAEDKDGNIHSAAYLMWDERSSYYHLSGEYPQFRSSNSSILMVWHCIQYTSKFLGLKTFDFEGSMIESIEKVRRNFGAQQIPYFNIHKHSSTTFKFFNSFKRPRKK